MRPRILNSSGGIWASPAQGENRFAETETRRKELCDLSLGDAQLVVQPAHCRPPHSQVVVLHHLLEHVQRMAAAGVCPNQRKRHLLDTLRACASLRTCARPRPISCPAAGAAVTRVAFGPLFSVSFPPSFADFFFYTFCGRASLTARRDASRALDHDFTIHTLYTKTELSLLAFVCSLPKSAIRRPERAGVSLPDAAL